MHDLHPSPQRLARLLRKRGWLQIVDVASGHLRHVRQPHTLLSLSSQRMVGPLRAWLKESFRRGHPAASSLLNRCPPAPGRILSPACGLLLRRLHLRFLTASRETAPFLHRWQKKRPRGSASRGLSGRWAGAPHRALRSSGLEQSVCDRRKPKDNTSPQEHGSDYSPRKPVFIVRHGSLHVMGDGRLSCVG